MNQLFRRPGAEPLPDSHDPVEIAMDLERDDHRPDSPARRLLVDQGRLVRTQIASERTGVALKLLTGVAGAVAAAVLAFMAWDASRTQALVVTPFSVPPELVARGMTGQVVATRLLDGLATLQSETLSNRPQGAYANDWGDDVQVQIPSTGVSIGELQDFLRGWLGHETNITGEIVRTGAGYSVTARAGAEPGKTFSGTEAELDALIAKASEAVYASTQPGRYAGWLVDKSRVDEAVEVYRRLSISGERKGRAWAFAEWSALAKTPEEKLRLAEQAVTLDPDQPTAHMALSAARSAFGHAEAVLAADRRVAELLKGPRAKELPAWSAVLNRKEKEAAVAAALGDRAGAAALYVSAAEPTPDQPPIACERCSSAAYFYAARELARNHDLAGAERLMQRGAAIAPQFAPVMRETLMLSSASARGDWPVVLAAMDAPAMQARLAAADPATQMRSVRPSRTLVLAKLRRGAEAQALIAPTPGDCYDCLRARGAAAAAAGDVRASERWFAEAARRAPSLPAAHQSWGEARLGRGDPDGAVRAFREAQKRGPRWAEPLKGEGDALARKGRHKEAVRLYAEAAERAPRWGGLHLAWGRSLQALGRREEARAKFAEAARLDLSAADRAEVRGRLGA